MKLPWPPRGSPHADSRSSWLISTRPFTPLQTQLCCSNMRKSSALCSATLVKSGSSVSNWRPASCGGDAHALFCLSWLWLGSSLELLLRCYFWPKLYFIRVRNGKLLPSGGWSHVTGATGRQTIGENKAFTSLQFALNVPSAFISAFVAFVSDDCQGFLF